jgi:HD-like signal output (HDOD) protein
MVLLLAVLAVLGLFFLLKRSSNSLPAYRPERQPAAKTTATRAASGTAATVQELHPIVRIANPQIEALLKDFVPNLAADLPAADAASIRTLLDQIPRPPSALHKLVSPAFLSHANTAELSEMVLAEPQVAAKVLATVNAPLYGLQVPLTSIGQAVTFLGMNTVRSMCLQYLLDESFQSKDPEVRKIFDGLWRASAFASELCFRLAPLLQLPEAGVLVTQVVLSFLGPVTSHALLPRSVALTMAGKSFLERSRTEQEQLGLCASELGSLLMQQWELPSSISEPVRDMGHILVTPCEGAPSQRDVRLAFCYFCARLGEKLASGQIHDLAAYAWEQDPDPDLYYLQTWLQQPGMEHLREALHMPELVNSINAMVMSTTARS